MTGSGTDSCTVTLNAAADSGGFAVSLGQATNSAVAVPATVTVPAGATSASFAATVFLRVSSAQTVTLTASAGGVAETFALQFECICSEPSSPCLC